jgi:hypothetical protein
LRFADFRTVTRDRTVEAPLDDATAIRKLAFECLARVELKRPIRLVGVRVGELSALVKAPAIRRDALAVRMNILKGNHLDQATAEELLSTPKADPYDMLQRELPLRD